MGDVERPDFSGGRMQWSLTRLATEFGLSRETVGKRLVQADVVPTGQRHGYDVYALEDAAPAILQLERERVDDPEQLEPTKRRAWFQSENERLKAETAKGNLCLRTDVHAEMSKLVKSLVQMLVTLPDILERDCGLSGQVVVRMHEVIDAQREALYQELVAEDEGAPCTGAAANTTRGADSTDKPEESR